ncbi:MAG: glutathione synthase/RimK-type ligase-like ATP-grasp enzyme [Pseudoalteromonas rhizosphaerae]|uniref:RimK family protein n=1 Tax=Pseudoalteromonas neustonica TaxID=1840331 RepID=A0ABY3FIQ6_9GAMM|nr:MULTISPECIES: RimK family protein [Pseudoalteromonas]MBB1291754.1 RimK family protein [Pseudoalteromonas sp. SR41-4]MBB1299820.1 RimK family protein [Pseudoalteromonas sp. SR44-8]MBB1308470.1 RimK family protein [Pseudoalteromonas sp. SR41-8]MBB1396549.1 RimK family protein [Pseudoalteromonas sp. SG44-8]MBB1407709.1 RimK family protein [Pseudoalteromonas sp. SG44-17]
MFKTLIVVDNNEQALAHSFENVITFNTYLRDYPKHNEPKTRIINLCDSSQYLSKGYYCSLLAEARKHQVLPSVKTINALRNGQTLMLNVGHLDDALYFGHAVNELQNKAAKAVFKQYPAPILFVDEAGLLQQGSLASLNTQQHQDFVAKLTEFTQTQWRISSSQKRYRWDMAILVDHNEKVPPSDKDAIARFIKAAAKHGIYAQALSFEEIDNIAQFDALFIRQTTAIDHPTYRLASKAQSLGLVVIDDAESILRCCNKVYLHDAFNYQKVPSLKTLVVADQSDETISQLEEAFTYPLVLKMPEGSFSKGVYKVTDRNELAAKLAELFEFSALVLAQEYMYTEYDWRVGVLNGRAIYACRYLMARNHWQIYNHDAKRFFSGGFETLPTFELPKAVLDAALKACKTVGKGLYGVDVKEHQGRAYVLEVNDNPSIDHKVEDGYLGDELYMIIMEEFKQRLEARGRS